MGKDYKLTEHDEIQIRSNQFFLVKSQLLHQKVHLQTEQCYQQTSKEKKISTKQIIPLGFCLQAIVKVN